MTDGTSEFARTNRAIRIGRPRILELYELECQKNRVHARMRAVVETAQHKAAASV